MFVERHIDRSDPPDHLGDRAAGDSAIGVSAHSVGDQEHAGFHGFDERVFIDGVKHAAPASPMKSATETGPDCQARSWQAPAISIPAAIKKGRKAINWRQAKRDNRRCAMRAPSTMPPAAQAGRRSSGNDIGNHRRDGLRRWLVELATAPPPRQ